MPGTLYPLAVHAWGGLQVFPPTNQPMPHGSRTPDGPGHRNSSSILLSLEVPAEVRARRYLRVSTKKTRGEGGVGSLDHALG